MKGPDARGHVLALMTALIWGVTFVSTKVLLEGLSPVEVLFLRFCIGYAALWVIRPRLFKVANWRDEALFAAMGVTGVTLYFLLENIALTYTAASFVGVIVATAPLATGLVAAFVLKEGKLGWNFFLGFALAMAGIALISFEGDAGSSSLLGCGLALAAAIMAAIYTNLSKRIAARGYDVVLCTRRMFFWGLASMLPFLPLLGFDPSWAYLAQPQAWGNLAFLGLGASALCYVMWNEAIRRLGPVKTAVYIYLTPVVTIAAAIAVLGEPLTAQILFGMALVIVGLVVSERKPRMMRKTPSGGGDDSAECGKAKP